MTPEEAVRQLTEAVENVAKSMKGIEDSGLTERALVTMLHDICGVRPREIVEVIDALHELGTYAFGYQGADGEDDLD